MWLRTVILPNTIVLLAAIPLIGWYNIRVTGRPTGLAFFEYARQHDQVPKFWILPPLTPKEYSNTNLRGAHQREKAEYQVLHNASPPVVLAEQAAKVVLNGVLMQFLAFGLLLAAIPWAKIRKRKKWLVLLLGLGAAALLPEIDIYGHYMAPYTIVVLILIVAGARALWYRIAASSVRGLAFIAALIVLLVPLAASYMGAIEQRRTERGLLLQRLTAEGGRHLVFVDYSEHWNPGYEWVYNGADLNASPVIFAHLFAPQENKNLLNHFPGRKIWLARVGPGLTEMHLEPYEPQALSLVHR